MMLIPSELHYSSIHGLGVFASADISKGTLIWQMDEEFERMIPVERVESWPPHMQDLMTMYAYPHPKKPGILILEIDNGRFMNHSVTPNTDFSSVSEGYAIRDIKKGEEITSNYSEFDPGFKLLP